jgi:hypothetical protein
MVAAGVALATFIAKDAVREDLKDLVDGIDREEAVYFERSDFVSVSLSVAGIAQQLEAQQTGGQFSAFVVQDTFARDWKRSLDGIRASVDAIRRLTTRLPKETQDKHGAEIQNVDSRIEAASVALDIFDQTNTQAKQNSRTLVPTITDSKTLATAAMQNDALIRNMLTETQKLSLLIFSDAEKIRREKQEAYDRFTKVSYVLYMAN